MTRPYRVGIDIELQLVNDFGFQQPRREAHTAKADDVTSGLLFEPGDLVVERAAADTRARLMNRFEGLTDDVFLGGDDPFGESVVRIARALLGHLRPVTDIAGGHRATQEDGVDSCECLVEALFQSLVP